MTRVALLAAASLALAACGGVAIKPDPVIPKALVEPLPTDVGLIVASDMRNFKQEETRWGSEWKIELGDGHLHMAQKVFAAAFRGVKEFPDLESARAASGLKALFEPRIEQYSFATARETGGRYYAVTVRYRINMYTPSGELADSLTLTGYGSSLAKGMSSGKPLELASIAAMRDAAARFLVQFPALPAGQRLARNEPILVEEKAVVASAAADAAGIEALPIEEGSPDPAPALASPGAAKPPGTPEGAMPPSDPQSAPQPPTQESPDSVPPNATTPPPPGSAAPAPRPNDSAPAPQPPGPPKRQR